MGGVDRDVADRTSIAPRAINLHHVQTPLACDGNDARDRGRLGSANDRLGVDPAGTAELCRSDRASNHQPAAASFSSTSMAAKAINLHHHRNTAARAAASTVMGADSVAA